MFKNNGMLFLVLLIMPAAFAAHKFDAYVDVLEDTKEEQKPLPIVLKSIENKRNEALADTYKQNIEVSSGKLEVGGKGFRFTSEQDFKTVNKKETLNIPLSELKDYFLKVPTDNSKILKLNYHLVDGGQKGKRLFIFLTRYLAGRVIDTHMKEYLINLTQLVEDKKKDLESIELNVIVDGSKMERSTVEAVPVFKTDNGERKATSVRPS